jgi:hypothetical protein
MIFGRFDERVHTIYDKPQHPPEKHDRPPHREQTATASAPPSG